MTIGRASKYYLFGLSLILAFTLLNLTPPKSTEFNDAPVDERPTVFGFYATPNIQSIARGLVMIHSAQKAGNTMPWVVFVTVEKGEKLELDASQSKALEKMNVTVQYMEKIWFPHWMKPAQQKFKILAQVGSLQTNNVQESGPV